MVSNHGLGSPPKAYIGFTLIELMIVVAIIGVLAAIALPSYEYAIRKARRAEARTALMQLMQLEERYYSVKNTYRSFDMGAINSAAASSDLKRFKWWSDDSPATSHYEISATACGGSGLDTCVALTAMQGSTNVKFFTDPQCGNYTLRSDGIRSVSVAGATGCW